MSDRPDFPIAWRSADRAMARMRPSPELDARVEASLSRAFPRSAVGAAAAAVAFACAIIWWWPEPAPQIESEADVALFTPASCAPAIPQSELALAPGCRVALQDPALSIEARTSVLLRRTTRGIRIIEGTAAFEVERVRRGSEVIVFVSGGRIEVVGTRFVVRETGESGSVSLEQGQIAFVTLDGFREDVARGAIYHWRSQRPTSRESKDPTAPAPPPPPAPPPRPAARARPQVPIAAPDSPPIVVAPDATPPITSREHEPDDLPPAQWSVERTARAVERVSELRARGRYAEAAALIEKLLLAPLALRAAEVLSFERGEILEHKLLDRDEACVHWRSHRMRFVDGRYQAEVTAALARCPETSSREGGE